MGADEVARTRVEPEHARALTTICGEVTVERLACRAPGVPNLYPADAVLNLPAEKHSHGLRRLAAIESARGSFDEAAVWAVYDCSPVPRTPDDIISTPGAQGDCASRPRPGPTARGKWLTASVVESIDEVITAVFDEATRRDPQHRRPWVALVDGNSRQIARIQAEAQRREVDVTVVIDFVHVLEGLWKAAWCFFDQGDRAAEAWIASTPSASSPATPTRSPPPSGPKPPALISGLTSARAPTSAPPTSPTSAPTSTTPMPSARAGRSPPASSKVPAGTWSRTAWISTGARWSLAGAEAVLRLRALISNGDFETYWSYHLEQEQQRVHHARYTRVDAAFNEFALAA